MSRIFQSLTVISIVTFAPTFLVGCYSNDSTATEARQSLGTVQLLLTGVGISGTEYRLRNATFDVSGASGATFSSEDYLDQATVQLVLQVGAYQIELLEGWTLERGTSDSYESVNAVLMSDNPVLFTIADQETTQVSFQFLAGDDVITVGQGMVEVSIEVVEQNGFTLEPGTTMEIGPQSPNGSGYVTTGDLNGDGWPDIALAAGYATGAIVVNQQDETFAPEVVVSESWWNVTDHIGATGVTLADMDLDGYLDYVFPIYGAHYSGKMIQLYQGDGNGNHTIPSQLPQGLAHTLSGANPMSTKVADFDHNGLPDIVSGSNNGTHTADIILQTSSWVFTPKFAYRENGSSNPQWIDIGDFNNDGWMDLVVPFLYGKVEVYLNTANGTGAMTHAGSYLSASHHEVTVADFDNDGFEDIAARCDSQNHVDVLYNNGAAEFSASATFAVSGTSGRIRAGDMNGDGHMDLVLCSISDSTVDVLLNDGYGAFQEAIPIVLDEPPVSVALDDFDQDGRIDVAVYTASPSESDHLRVLWNRESL